MLSGDRRLQHLPQGFKQKNNSGPHTIPTLSPCLWIVIEILDAGLISIAYISAKTIVWVSWLNGSVSDLQARDRGFDPRLG